MNIVKKSKNFAVCVDSWFDGERHRPAPVTFVINDGIVVDIAMGDRSSALTEQGLPVTCGRFLMPGLVDAHAHLFLDGAPTDRSSRSAESEQGRTGGFSRLEPGRKSMKRRNSISASTSFSKAKSATPDFEVWVPAPPSCSWVTFSWVTVFTTSGPVTNM